MNVQLQRPAQAIVTQEPGPSSKVVELGGYLPADNHGSVAPRALADIGLRRGALIDLTLKHFYVEVKPSTLVLAARLGLPATLLVPLFECMRRAGLVEPVEAGPLPHERVWALAAEGRRRAARAMDVSRYVGPAPVSLEAYRREIGRDIGQIGWPRPAALAELLKQTCLDSHQVDALGTAFAGEGLIFIHGPSGSGKTHMLKLLSSMLTGSIRVPHAIAVGESIHEVFDPRLHRPCAESAQAGTNVDRRWVSCLRPTIRVGSETLKQLFDPHLDGGSGRYSAPHQVKANGGMLLIDDFDANRPQAAQLIDRWRALLETGVDRLRFPDGSAVDLPVSGRMVLAASLAPEALGGEALVRRLAGRVDLARLPECVYRAWVERLYTLQGCASPRELSGWLVDMHRSAGLPLAPGVAVRLLQIAADGARYRGESLNLDRVALERAWHVHRGLPIQAGRPPDASLRRGTIATPQHRRAPGSIDVRSRQPHQPA